MKTPVKILFLFISIVIYSSCESSSETINAEANNATNNTINNTTITGDTSKENVVGELIDGVVDLGSTIIQEKQRKDSIRDANEPRLWVYQIGDSYDDDDLIAKAYDKLKESENDLYVFKRNNSKYFLIKGYGVSTKEQLNDSIKTIQNRISDRISFLDLSKLCKKLPTNTKSIKYKIDREKREALCKTCE